MRIVLCAGNFKNCFAVLFCFLPVFAFSQVATDSVMMAINARKFNSSLQKSNNPSLNDTNSILNKIAIEPLKKTPFLSFQQYIKGNAAGSFVREENGEPVAEQFIFIRGLTTPLFNKQDVYSVQPAIYINGLPMVQENAFTYNIQRYDFNKIGSGSNPFASIDMNYVESVEILKTPADLAKLGPIASNGAIWINTRKAKSGFRQFNFESYFGMLQRPNVYTLNSRYEYDFRNRYYEKYATIDQKQNMPVYIKNQNDLNYYGPADWDDVYYKSKPIYYIGAGMVGGSDRANFLFNISDTKDHNFDATGVDRYALLFGINMLPIKWLTISTNLNVSRLQRTRNRSLRDRFAETRFVPDLTNPISPGKNAYQNYLDKYRGSEDNNRNNSVFGVFSLTAKFDKLELKSNWSIDYEESLRDVFWGKPLMDGNNFLSTYNGFNQRISILNTASYKLSFNKVHNFLLEAGQNFTSDFYKYDYILGYNTPNDFIKIKQIVMNSSTDIYENVFDIFAYPFSDKLKASISSLYGTVNYSYKNLFDISVLGRYDGFSSFAETARWLFTPVVAGKVNLHNFIADDKISTLRLKGSWGIFGKLLQDNRFAIGPQYRVDLGYAAEPTLGTYAGLPGLSQPYSSGWINRYYNWPFSEKLNIGFEIGALADRYLLGIDFYNNNDKNMIVPVGMPAENGFAYKFVQGMQVQNRGINLNTVLNVIKNRNNLNWLVYANFNWNQNKLIKLPYNLSEITYAGKKIEVGKPIDSYWLYQNNGIINTAADIPDGKTNPDGSVNPLTFSGLINFSPGDALWHDINKDGTIDQRDKVLQGHSMPVYTGGMGSNTQYKKFNFDFQFYYALGHQLLNQSTANKLDFVNNENSKDIANVKEVTFWQKTFDYEAYPLYNPWSSTIPYRLDQDLFLEKADYVKLRYITLGYDFSTTGFFKKSKFSRALLYVTGSNLLTLTSFNGDPEQVSYSGIYRGRSLPMPKSYIVGVKFNF